MKTREYYEKFLADKKKFGDRKATTNLAIGLASEVKDIAEKRNAKSDQALISIIKEINQEWNVIARMDLQFKRNGFIEFIKSEMPFLKRHLEIGKQHEKTKT